MHRALRSTVVFGMRRGHRHERSMRFTVGVLFLAVASYASVPAADVDFVSDRNAGITLQHSQQWGDFGIDTAAARTGTAGSRLQIGEKTFDKGLGHHANGEILLLLEGRYRRQCRICHTDRCPVHTRQTLEELAKIGGAVR